MNTPKNFALQLGALISLYVSITSLVTLLFSVLTLAFPDAADSYYTVDNATETIRFSVAVLIVTFPAYLWMTRTVNQIRRTENGAYLTLTKWAVYLSLLIGGGVLLGDVVAVIYGYLNGEITTRFILKALVLGLVLAMAFYYYLKDAQNYWQTHETESKRFGVGAALIVLAAIVLGFMYSETPQEVRDMRIDDNQVTDLQDMQMRIEQYYRTEDALPESIATVYVGQDVPTAPEGRQGYEYNVTGDASYELCATFAHDSSRSDRVALAPIGEKNYDWSHSEGRWCFERTVTERQ